MRFLSRTTGTRCWNAAMLLMMAGVCFAVEDSPLSVDVFFGWDGYYKPTEWTPVEITVSSRLKEPFAGRFTISAQQDGLNRLNVSHDIVLTPETPLYLPLSTKFNFAAENCNVRITDTGGRTVWSSLIPLWDFSQQSRSLMPVQSADLLVGLVGRSRMGLIGLADKLAVESPAGEGELYVKDKLPRMMPWDWTGYMSLDVLVLYDLQWDSLGTSQWKAVTEWVSNGGRLLVIAGVNPIPADCPLRTLLPLTIESQQDIQVDEAVSSAWLDAPASGCKVTAWPVSPKQESPMWTVQKTASGKGVFAAGWVGFGKVGFLSFDPETLSDSIKSKAETLWMCWLGRMLEQPLREYLKKAYEANRKDIETPDNSIPNMDFNNVNPLMSPKKLIIKTSLKEDENQKLNNRYNYRINTGSIAANQVMEYLYNIPQMRPLSVWWVILLLTLLALLLGPIDYIVLKRMDKLPWTWVTCAFWILVFSAGSYYGVQALRAGQMQIRTVSVTDYAGDGPGWMTAYSGIFSPGSNSYEMTGMNQYQWWSATNPTQEYLYYRGGQNATVRTLSCMQHDGGNLPYQVPIHLWTMQTLLLEEPLSVRPLESRVSLSDGRVNVAIINRSDRAIIKGIVLFKDREAFSFQGVEANSTKTFEGGLEHNRDLGWLNFTQVPTWNDSYYYPGSGVPQKNHLVSACWAQGSCQRNDAFIAYLNAGAAIVCAEYASTAIPFGIKNQIYEENHIQIVRQIVFPEQPTIK